MNTKFYLSIFLVFVFIACPLFGQEKSETVEQKIKINLTERFRFVGFDNSISLDDTDPQTFAFNRIRTNLSISYKANVNLDIFAKFTNEFRIYLTPDREFNFNEIFTDNLYVKWKNVGNLPLNLSIGRQNIMLGEGFIVMDGHPLDGSRSIYFNAIRGDYQFKKNHSITGFISYVPETDNLLPIINSMDQKLIEQPEFGLGLYYTGNFKPFQLEAYIIHKGVDDTEAISLNSNIQTFGLRNSFSILKPLSFTFEGAYQSGKLGELSRSAFGGYFHLDYKCNKFDWFDKAQIGGIYLSGDDSATEKHEGWDPVFSRWPKWSESFIYTLIKENQGKVAYWSNLTALYFSLNFLPGENINFNFSYYHLGAVRETPNNDFTSGTGTNRGDLFIGNLKFKINKYLNGHFIWEHFQPGNYYFTGADSFNWFRFELLFKI